MGWVEKRVLEIAPLQRGFDLPTSQIEQGEFPIVYSNGVGGSHKFAMVKGPGVVTGRSGTIGSLTFVEKDFYPHNTTLWVTNFNNNDAKFIYYLYHLIDWQRYATGSGVPTLNRNDVHELRLSLPTDKTEQHAIAAAISNADAYINALEKLITKKRAVKQGAMQELLTGQRRLPGFEDEWVEKPLGDIAEVTKLAGFEFTAHIVYADKGHVIALRGLNVKSGHLDLTDVKYIDNSNFSKLSRSKLTKGDMLFTYVGTIGDVALVDCDNKYYLAPNVALIRYKEEVNPQFMLYQFMSSKFVKNVINPLIASTTQSALSMANIRLFSVKTPNLAEQTAIAAIFSDMDAEIDALTAKLEKARRIKQGMMSELLTGRIRLIEEDTDNGEN